DHCSSGGSLRAAAASAISARLRAASSGGGSYGTPCRCQNRSAAPRPQHAFAGEDGRVLAAAQQAALLERTGQAPAARGGGAEAEEALVVFGIADHHLR